MEQDADTIALLWCPDRNDADLVEMTFARNRGLRRDLSPRFARLPRSVGWKGAAMSAAILLPAVRGHLGHPVPLPPSPPHQRAARASRRILWLPGRPRRHATTSPIPAPARPRLPSLALLFVGG